MRHIEELDPVALTIAGSDPSAGAGIQADLKTFSALGVYGASAITALTAQNTVGVQDVFSVPPAFVGKQLGSVFDDLNVRAVKTGMLGTSDVIQLVVEVVRSRLSQPGVLVVDPVMVATSGDRLLARDAEDALRQSLLPCADLLTPNIAEAAVLLGCAPASSEDDLRRQGHSLLDFGCRAVLMKGGHGGGEEAVDILVTHDRIHHYRAPRVNTSNTHGTGCTLSAAIAAFLVRGLTLERAVGEAKAFLSQALVAGSTLKIGRGDGPVDHLYGLRGLKF